MKKRVLYSIFLLFTFCQLIATNVCLPDWKYRLPIVIDNTSGSAISDYSLAIPIDMQSLIIDGKMSSQGQDIRVLNSSGNILPNWIEETSLGTSNATIWIKLDLTATTRDTIYLFYGNPSASSISSGTSVFTVFDDFEDPSLNTSLWKNCGTGTASIANGQLNLTGIQYLYSTTLSSDTLITEAFIAQVPSNTGSSELLGIGQLDTTSKQGYALAYEQSIGAVFIGKQLTNDGGGCIQASNEGIVSSHSVGSPVNDRWQFSWLGTGLQELSWPSDTVNSNFSVNSYPVNKAVTIFSELTSSNAKVEWIAGRKYTSTPPEVTLLTEDTLAGPINITGIEESCQGDTVTWEVTKISGATYVWTHPSSGIIAGADSSVLLLKNVQNSDVGTYEVNITIDACNFSGTKDLTVSHLSEAGALSGVDTLCQSANSGSLTLNGKVGNVAYWESSLSGNAPWNTISQTDTVLDYVNLSTTNYYRALVQNGACLLDTSNVIKLTIVSPSDGGFLLGSDQTCKEDNNGSLTLINQEGNIKKWQYSTSSSIWVDTILTNFTFDYSDLDTTTDYRVIVQSGVCEEDTSTIARININELPNVSFSSDTACEGDATNLTTPTSGTNYLWNFGDGNSSPLANTSYIFPNTGKTAISLTVTDANNCVNSVEDTIIVTAIPSAFFTTSNQCEDELVTLSNQTPSTDIQFYIWDFLGDNSIVDTVSTKKDTILSYTEGTYPVMLTAVSDKGCTGQYSTTLEIYPEPSAAFTVSDTVGINESTLFTNSSNVSSGNLLYTWNFGTSIASDTSSLTSPTFVYNTADTYSVSLVAKTQTDRVCTDTTTKMIVAVGVPSASFSYDTACLGDVITFVNNSDTAGITSTYLWNFGDGTTSTLKNPLTKLYSSAGSYQVQLTVDNGISSNQTSTIILVSPLPVPRFNVDDICLEETSQFQNTSFISSGNLSYQWDFGDGNNSSDQFPVNNYIGEGKYLVKLIATSSFSCKDSIIDTAIVWPLPQVNFNFNEVCDGDTSIFTNTSTIGSLSGETISIQNYLWDFGDGNISSSASPTKRYLNAGNYSVNLTATSNKGCSVDTAQSVSVKENPIANFTADNECIGTLIPFTNTSFSPSGTTPSYVWDFGDGTNSISSTPPSKVYTNAASYNVTLNITTDGCTDSTTKTVSVFGTPSLSINASDTLVSLGNSTQLTASNGSNFLWSPSTTVSSPTSQSTLATPTEDTEYIVFVNDDNGCTTTDTILIQVIEDYSVSPTNVLTPDDNGKNDTWVIQNIENYGDCTVKVFDRWGNEVYKKENYQNDWNGTRGADILPDGTYYYVVTFKNNGRTYKGALNIIRKAAN